MIAVAVAAHAFSPAVDLMGGGSALFDPGSCCWSESDGTLQFSYKGETLAGPCKNRDGNCGPCHDGFDLNPWAKDVYCTKGQYCKKSGIGGDNSCVNEPEDMRLLKCNEEDGRCTCPPEKTATLNEKSPPSSNGCGPDGGDVVESVLIQTALTGFDKCCDAHDICYGSVNSKWQDCNSVQKDCEDKIDDSVKSTNVLGIPFRTWIAEKFVGSAIGWDAFMAAQHQSVKCV